MTHDWLLVETLGTEPAVVAQGRRTKNLIPISAFLRRSPNLMAIQTAIAETVRTGESMSTITPRNDRVIRTEAVQMSDGRMHGVQVWIGPPDVEPPERLVPGPLKWDLTAGVATDTPESIYNSGETRRPKPPMAGPSPKTCPCATSTRARSKVLVDGDQVRAGHDALQHLGSHRSPRRDDLRRLRRRARTRKRRKTAASGSSVGP